MNTIVLHLPAWAKQSNIHIHFIFDKDTRTMIEWKMARSDKD